ncbi:TIGR03364 family FAD-dependent oxidoreductase [Pseudomonas protegens]|jgi:FAD dependent oxidoreductase TIGR03364|uniref:FAD dependent oxidoreductase, TIGR03364 family n=2 Tax=Pseudomonas protegens TaxID=380021 RepID=Q4K488_PSEF5|nr:MULTISPECIES: TIGR03364 family FAD-dependent oxidoreductase [Pseudomonas]AAY95077.1 FAD dependent oxidoreductase, TIGR03364 family [Pseudomonas protegens Pf-5]ASE20776.1 TIGR03364 family FAD-dependent oxidoreductase [Pseudomonas protegens]MBF0639317.1 TIGR03364 family FAD-dependent oxidoreductase [Pseudomonas protegens]MBP5101587.1 TIGR03364 family FAD-dependent oxidoreductase [Pseudomonas protegens]MBP5129416.1 TIGR03364 family FAD-dependent oxidoreductase [Pseudomonas protegens]
MTNHSDLLIVGAGILGLSHAYAAAKRGLRVHVFERSATPLGASVRNFGQALVTGQPPGTMLELARASREIWADWQQLAGLQLKRNGSFLFARSEAEEQLLEAFCAGRALEHGYRVELLQGAALNDLYGGQFRHHRAALHGLDDQQLYSREAIPQLIDYLRRDLGVQFHFSTLVRDIQPGQLRSTAGNFHAPRIVLCSGHDYQTLLADQIAALQPQICRLQMLRARPEANLNLQHALLTGLSCVHYGAFADLPEAAAVQAQILREAPHLHEHGIHLLISPTPYGELIIGDSHDYGSDPSPFNAEQVDNWLLELAEQTLGCRVRVVERWQGVYGARGPAPFSFLEAAPGVHVALMHTGVGMSVGPAMAEGNIARLLEEA